MEGAVGEDAGVRRGREKRDEESGKREEGRGKCEEGSGKMGGRSDGVRRGGVRSAGGRRLTEERWRESGGLRAARPTIAPRFATVGRVGDSPPLRVWDNAPYRYYVTIFHCRTYKEVNASHYYIRFCTGHSKSYLDNRYPDLMIVL